VEVAPVLLTGTHPRTLDDKKRLALPRRLRDQLGDAALLYLVPGPEQSVWVYTQEMLEKQADRLDQAPPGEDMRAFRRLYFAQSEAVEVDRSGRILLPDRLLQLAGLGHDVVLLGVRDHLEVWDAARWQAYLDRHAAGFDRVARV
jgi:MraZ protein